MTELLVSSRGPAPAHSMREATAQQASAQALLAASESLQTVDVLGVTADTGVDQVEVFPHPVDGSQETFLE